MTRHKLKGLHRVHANLNGAVVELMMWPCCHKTKSASTKLKLTLATLDRESTIQLAFIWEWYLFVPIVFDIRKRLGGEERIPQKQYYGQLLAS